MRVSATILNATALREFNLGELHCARNISPRLGLDQGFEHDDEVSTQYVMHDVKSPRECHSAKNVQEQFAYRRLPDISLLYRPSVNRKLILQQ